MENTVLRCAKLAHLRAIQKVTGEQFKKSQVILAYYHLEKIMLMSARRVIYKVIIPNWFD